MIAASKVLDPAVLPAFVDPDEGRLMMALKFYELGRLSLGQAAELAGYPKRGFIDILAKHGIPALQSPPQDLASESEW
jgi:predicted HTH domain antitoxin